MKEIAIKAQNLNKTFLIPSEKRDRLKTKFLNIFQPVDKKRVSVLKDINFEINTGEFVSLIGENGSGKSTMLKLIAGIYEEDSGSLEVNGNIVPFLELGVGFNPDLSARENIFLNGTILGMKKAYLIEKFDDIVDFAEIRKFLDMPVKNFSSGMQVRLAFSIAIQAKASIYILDEILSVGDQAFQEKSLEHIRKLKKEGKTILYVSHDAVSVKEYSDKVILLHNGKVHYQGDPDEALKEYNEVILDKQNLSADKSLEKQQTKESYIKDLLVKKSGTETDELASGDDFEIVLELSKAPKSDYNVGFGVYTAKGDYVAGINTEIDTHKISKEHKQISLKIINNPLLSGKYYINTVLYTDNEKKPLDFAGRVKYFRIIKSPKYRGSTNLEHEWQSQ